MRKALSSLWTRRFPGFVGRVRLPLWQDTRFTLHGRVTFVIKDIEPGPTGNDDILLAVSVESAALSFIPVPTM